ncbi:uncharacterized protein LOC106721541 isoform X1 [Papilio machaon]|uniref:uncharacterized protein LOC106721541 isoform X1 n=1 Tax=Papilio machaon TaxID=76193 RepID=UPI001E665C87|nr:uncharacterized protein LOC106721541 isoform X1 [Papilio machaon]
MTSTPQQVNNVPTSTEGALGKRKKSRNSKGSYFTKWLDKTMRHTQETTANTNPYDSYVAPNLNWPVSNTFVPNHEVFRNNMYGYLPEPPVLPTSSMYYNPHVHPVYNSGYRCMHHSNETHRPRLRRNEIKAEEVSSAPIENVDSMISHNYMPKNSDSQDCTSLPPIVTSIGDTNSTSDLNVPKEDSNNARRYSDPCVRGLPDVARPANGDVDSSSEESSEFSENEVGSRLLACLLDQITTLKGANEKLNRELQETRAELETLRHQTAFIQNASSTNLGATGSPLNNGLLNGQYPPGFLTDLVREIRDAARLREEALYTRVRAMVLERIDNSYSSTESKKSERTIEDLKSALRAADADSRRMMDRIAKLEEDMRLLRVNESDTSENRITNGNIEDAETERLRLRKEIENIRKAKQSSDEHALKLERLVTQLRSKFTGHQSTNGPESLPSESEHDTNARIRRTSGNSSNNSTVVFGPVTDL